MLYINQLCTPSFPIGLIKTESGFIVRSVETGLGRWTLVVAVISVDAYPFLAFSDLTCHLEDTGIGVFWLHCAAWYEETELGSSDLEAFPSAGKSTGVVSVPYSLMEVFLFPVVWILLRSLGVICYDRWVLSEGHKSYFKDWCLMN